MAIERFYDSELGLNHELPGQHIDDRPELIPDHVWRKADRLLKLLNLRRPSLYAGPLAAPLPNSRQIQIEVEDGEINPGAS